MPLGIGIGIVIVASPTGFSPSPVLSVRILTQSRGPAGGEVMSIHPMLKQRDDWDEIEQRLNNLQRAA
jgi:hypothetical protein